MDKVNVYETILGLPELSPEFFGDIIAFGKNEGIIFYITHLRYVESIICIENHLDLNIEQEIYLQMWKEFTFNGKIPTHQFVYTDRRKTYSRYYYLICVEKQRERDQRKHDLSVTNNFIKQVKQNKDKNREFLDEPRWRPKDPFG
jgi:hypothetical protein